MQQIRRTCVALYIEDEYQELVIETHFDYKWLNNLIGNWPSFRCKFCKVCMKNNNIFSYHRMMNRCASYKGKELLKMYRTWNKNETKEITRLCLKFGKTILSQNKHLALDEANLHPKRAAPYPRFGKTWFMPCPRPKQGIEDICIINSDDDFLLTPHKHKGKQLGVVKLSISRNNPCVQDVPKEKAKVHAQNKIATLIFGLQFNAN